MRHLFHDNPNEESGGGAAAAAANDNRRRANAKFIIYAQGQLPFSRERKKKKEAKHGFSVGYK